MWITLDRESHVFALNYRFSSRWIKIVKDRLFDRLEIYYQLVFGGNFVSLLGLMIRSSQLGAIEIRAMLIWEM